MLNYISEGSVSHINGVWPNSRHSQLSHLEIVGKRFLHLKNTLGGGGEWLASESKYAHTTINGDNIQL